MRTLETERLVLVPVSGGHEAALHRLHSDPFIVHAIWDGRVPSPQETRQKLVQYLDDWRDRGLGFWMVYEKRQGGLKLVGRAGFRQLAGTNDIELGYCFLKAASGKGIAGEAAKAVLLFAFTTSGIKKVVAVVAPDNHRAIRAAEKLELQYIEERRHQAKLRRFYELEREAFFAAHHVPDSGSTRQDTSLPRAGRQA
ncbi:MAG: GNAT family N-acetyltransferase [Kiloniellales bacterium]